MDFLGLVYRVEKEGKSYVLKSPYPLEQDPYQLHDDV